MMRRSRGVLNARSAWKRAPPSRMARHLRRREPILGAPSNSRRRSTRKVDKSRMRFARTPKPKTLFSVTRARTTIRGGDGCASGDLGTRRPYLHDRRAALYDAAGTQVMTV